MIIRLFFKNYLGNFVNVVNNIFFECSEFIVIVYIF